MSDAMLVRLAAELDASPPDDADASGSLEQVASTLKIPGHALRVVTLDRTTLARMKTPLLVQVGGALGVLRKRARGRLALETAERSQVLKRDALLARAGDRSIELLPTLGARRPFTSRLLQLASLRARELSKLVLLSATVAGLGLALPYATEHAVDHALPEGSPQLLALLALASLFIVLQRALFGWLEARVSRGLASRLESGLSLGLFSHLLNIPFRALVQQNLGGWLETLRSAQHVQQVLLQTVLVPLLEGMLGLAVAVALLRENAAIGVMVSLASLSLLAVTLLYALRAARLEQAVVEASAQQNDALYEILAGLPTLRSAGASSRAVLRWLERLVRARSTSAAIDALATDGRALLGALREAIGIAVLIWASHACLQAKLSVGSLLAVVMLADRFVGVVVGIAGAFAPLLALRAHVARVDTLLSEPDVTASRAQHRPTVSRGEDAVVLDDVWFRYGPEQPWILKGHSLRVPTLAQLPLSGPSGSGKTTILRLIAGLYTPERGSVRVFGYAPGNVVKEICYLPQDAHLFQGSIRQNLELLSDRAAWEEILSAARDSGLDAFAATLPMGYETVLPSGGGTLSGGQRQLLVWTAAMASGRRLLLLDEALSQVDRISRRGLLAMAKHRARTMLSVQHESC